MSYKIVRMYFRGGKRTIVKQCTLTEAKAHCSNPETSWKTCTSSTGKRRARNMGPWFDGYEEN